jgi:hypothetical protein
MFLIRLPTALLLLALIAASLLGAVSITAVQLGTAEVATLSSEAQSYGETSTWLQAGLMYAAALLFFISLIRLFRRTHGFWPWLFGFALFGGAWALTHSVSEWQTLASQFPPIDQINAGNAQAVAMQALDQGVLPLAVGLLAGLLILVIDAVDGPLEHD